MSGVLTTCSTLMLVLFPAGDFHSSLTTLVFFRLSFSFPNFVLGLPLSTSSGGGFIVRCLVFLVLLSRLVLVLAIYLLQGELNCYVVLGCYGKAH